METSLAQAILTKLQAASQVCLVLHRRPDADSMGAAAAMEAFLLAQGIPSSYFCATPLPPEAAWFGIDESRMVLNGNPGQSWASIDVICTFDGGDLQHLGLDGKLPYLINFDHHATNTHFGQRNVVQTSCASTTELMYHFFQALRWPIPTRVAAYLLAGLLNDTDHFSNPATSGAALQTAGELIGRGVTLTALRALLFEKRGIPSLRLIGEALGRLKLNPCYGVAVTYITEDDLARHQVRLEDIEGITNILNCLGEAKAMCLLKSEAGVVRVSLRTTQAGVDVSRLAAYAGGGGHRKAAGFTIHGALTIAGGRVRVL